MTSRCPEHCRSAMAGCIYMVSGLVYLFETLSACHLAPSPLTDGRNFPPLNRIGDPDGILASVRVENGKAGSFPPQGSLVLNLPIDTFLCRFLQRHTRRCHRIASAPHMVLPSSPKDLRRSSRVFWKCVHARRVGWQIRDIYSTFFSETRTHS
jgi:hypothetical protein